MKPKTRKLGALFSLMLLHLNVDPWPFIRPQPAVVVATAEAGDAGVDAGGAEDNGDTEACDAGSTAIVAAGAGPADAGAPDPDTLYGCTDAPSAEQVDGGWYLPQLRAERVACLLAACRKHRDDCLEARSEDEVLSKPLVAVTVLLSLVGGFFLGALWRASREEAK